MTFQRRGGAFLKQKDEQMAIMCLFCHECSIPQINRKDLEQHLSSVHNVKRFQCLWPNCFKSYDDSEALGQHVRREHKRRTWECPKGGSGCMASFRSHNRLHRHMYYHHSNGLFKCDHPGCGYGPKISRNAIYSHFRREHRPKMCKDPYDEAPFELAQANNPCAICLRPMTQLSQNRRLSCPHAFHLRCLVRWAKGHQTCPSCRKRFDPRLGR